MVKKPVIFPIDGKATYASAISSFVNLFQYHAAREMVGMVKLNDALHISPGGGKELITGIRDVSRENGWGMAEIFLDLKLFDVSGTISNILKQYAEMSPAVITVSSEVSCQSLFRIREIFPSALIALVGALTDISEDEFRRKHGMTPVEYIAEMLLFFEDEIGEENPIGAFVCSPLEVRCLKDEFGDRFKAIVPGVRSLFMDPDHQKRVASPYDALLAGAESLVIGSQLKEGLQAGLFQEERVNRTNAEIQRAYTQLAC